MTGNKIENKGGMFFAAMLQVNSSLVCIDYIQNTSFQRRILALTKSIFLFTAEQK